MQKSTDKQEITKCSKCGYEWMERIVAWKYINKTYELDQEPTKIGFPMSIFRCVNCCSLQEINYSSGLNNKESLEYIQFLNDVLPVD